MAYNISLSNNEPLVTIADGTVDVNYTSLNLVGKNYPNYGFLLNQNFVYLLENFASAAEPTNPLTGQLWYDTGEKSLKVKTTAGQWKPVSSTIVSSDAPSIPDLGDHWWDINNSQLKVWSGDEWKVIGPQFSQGAGITGAIPDTVIDDTDASRNILKFYVGGTLVSIWSKESESFNLVGNNRMPGFFEGINPQVVNPGLTMADLGRGAFGTYTDVPKNIIWGTAEKALTLENVEMFLATGETGTTQQVIGKVSFSNNIEITGNLSLKNIQTSEDAVYDIGSPDNRFGNLYSKAVYSDHFYYNDGTNFAEDKVGSLDSLLTDQKANAVVAINEVKSAIGDLTLLNSSVTDNLVNALNSILVSVGNQALPAGVVVMWSGTVTDIPSGWALCNGAKGTPDLRNRFVIGAGSGYIPTAIGGSKDSVVVSHTHTGSASNAGSHTHTATADSQGAHTHTMSASGTSSIAGGHNHLTGNNEEINPFAVENAARYGYADAWASVRDPTAYGTGYDTYTSTVAGHSHTFAISGTSSSAGAHNHGISVNTVADHSHTISVNAEGVTGVNANLPPYYALCFIMKL